jgi:hypothetical protein
MNDKSHIFCAGFGNRISLGLPAEHADLFARMLSGGLD